MNDWIAHHLLGLPELAASTGHAVDNLIVYVHWLMAALFVGWIIYFFYVLRRFQKARNPQASHEGSKSPVPTLVEFGVVAIEAVLLLGIAIPLWGKNVEQFPSPENSTVLQVVAQQYDWNVRYAGPDGKFGAQEMRFVNATNIFGFNPADAAAKDDVQLLNEFYVPVDKPVLIYLSSKDVIHSLKIIAMRVTQDAIPGLRIPCTFTPTKVGRYQLSCAQLCGGGHSGMTRGFLNVLNEADYDKWIKEQVRKNAPAPKFE